MTTASVDKDILRLHTDAEGIVWYGRHGLAAVRTAQKPEEFVTKSVLRDAAYIRVLGVPENAELITKIHELRVNRAFRPTHVQIGSPGVCLQTIRLKDPTYVLSQIWQPCVQAQACGCWHELVEREYTTYLLLTALRKDEGRWTDLSRRALTYHPAWTAISFVPTHSPEHAGRMLCEIIDPRWYNHPQRPNRLSRLWSHLGLEPRNFSPDMAQRNRPRAVMAWKAWSQSSKDVDLDDPRNFLHRVVRRRSSKEEGYLVATKKFVQLVCLVWLQGMTVPGREVFVPSIFFKKEDELAAYTAHVRRLGRRV